MSCAYWAPKSTTRTVSCSGCVTPGSLPRTSRTIRDVADLLSRQRQATYRFWREDVSVRPGGAWADLGGVQVHTTGLPPRHWNGAFLTGIADLDRVLSD